MSDEFAHPGTGEYVIVDSSAFADTAQWFADFSPEGEMLAEHRDAAEGGGR